MHGQAGRLVAVGASAVLWCVLHSLPIARGVEPRLLARLGGRAPWFRLLYNLLALATLLGLLLWWGSLPRRTLFGWPGWWQAVRWGGLLLAGWLFWAGAGAYRGEDFTGLRRAVRSLRGRRGRPRPRGTPGAGPPAPPAAAPGPDELRRDGVLAHLRHPWYAGAILFFLCCLPWTDVNLVWRAVFVAYTVVGTLLEERKLRARFGRAYERYRREVPRYLPRPWRRREGGI